jgi:signal transduction histidine kinase
MTTISILSDVAKKQIENNIKPAPIMDEIGSNARELMEKLDDIVWSVNPKNDTLNQMVLRMKRQAIDLLGNKDIKVNFNIPENIDNIGLPMESRRNVFLIYKEAVHNISKYADAKNVNIIITVSKNELKVTISDDGKGFIIQEAEDGNGLENMQERAKQSGGKCVIESEKGKGTIVAFSIPV